MILKSSSVKIAGVGSAVPKKVVSNSELVKRIDSTDAWILKNLGIQERRISSGVDESSSKLGALAAQRAILDAGISLEDVGGVIVSTATPDQKAPSTACLIQNHLGISNLPNTFQVYTNKCVSGNLR